MKALFTSRSQESDLELKFSGLSLFKSLFSKEASFLFDILFFSLAKLTIRNYFE